MDQAFVLIVDHLLQLDFDFKQFVATGIYSWYFFLIFQVNGSVFLCLSVELGIRFKFESGS